MKRITVLFALCLLMPMMGLAQDDDDSGLGLEVTNVQPLDDIVDGLPGFNTAIISPDGTMLAYEGRQDDNESGICVHTFETLDTTCTPYPQETPDGERIRISRPLALQWSPDNTMVVIEPSSLIFFEDGDIWVYDVVNLEFTNLTDDGYEGSLRFDEGIDGLPIDLLPVWSPTGDLYFVRYIDDGDDISTELFVIRNNAGSFADEPELIADLTTNQDEIYAFYNTNIEFSLDGAASLLPDGTQMALLFRPRERDNSGVWIVDLQSGDITQEIPMPQELYATSLPEWTQNGGYIPDGISWLDEDTLVVTGISLDLAAMIGFTAFTLDLSTETFSPIFDFTDIASAGDYFSRDSEADAPRLATLSPNHDYLLFSQRIDIRDGRLSAIPVSGGESFDVYVDEDESPRGTLPASRTSQGNNGEIARALLHGVIYTFRMTE